MSSDSSQTPVREQAGLWPRVKVAVNIVFLTCLLASPVPVYLMSRAPKRTSGPFFSSSPASQPAGRAERKIKLRFMTWGAPEQLQQAKEINDEFLAAYPDIHVELLVANMRYASKLSAMMASHETPDVFLASPGMIAAFCDREDPLFMDITDLVVEDIRKDQARSADDPDRLDFADILPQAVQTFYCNGRLYGLPRDYKSAGFGYNADMLAELGLEDPNDLYARNEWTWEKLLEYLMRLTRDVAGPGGTKRHVFGLFQDSFNEGYWHNTLLQAGGGIWTDDSKDLIIDRAESIRGLQFVRDLPWKHNVAKPWTSELGLDDPWVGQETATLGFRGWHVPRFIRNTYQFDTRRKSGVFAFPWDVAPWPLGPVLEGQLEPVHRHGELAGYRLPCGRVVLPKAVQFEPQQPGQPRRYRLRGCTATGIGYVMSAETRHRPEAWKLLKFLVSRRAQELRATFRLDYGGVTSTIPGSDMPSRASAVPFYLDAARNNPLRPRFTGTLEHKNRQPMWPNVEVFINAREYGRPATGALGMDAVGRELDRQFQRMLLDENVTPEEVAANTRERAKIIYRRIRDGFASSFNTPSLVRPADQDPLGLAP